MINHRDYLTNGRIITSSAINISETEVLTAEGRFVPYDYLVIATGHTYPTIPKTRTERLKQYQEGKKNYFIFLTILYVFMNAGQSAREGKQIANPIGFMAASLIGLLLMPICSISSEQVLSPK